METEKGFTRRELLIGAGALILGFAIDHYAGSILTRPIVPQLSKEQARSAGHYPIDKEGKEVPAIPYLTLPFREADLGGKYDITEGWRYSPEEHAIHGFTDHNGIDIAVPFGTPVIAPADGYAISTYQTFWIKNDDGTPRMYQEKPDPEKPLRFGLGNFVQLYVPSVNRFVVFGHLSDVAPAIPFSLPIANGEDWTPTNHTLKIAELVNHPMVVKVKKGQFLGKVGYSGLAFGYEDYRAGATRPVLIDPRTQKSWDEPHVHLEDYFRDQLTGLKIANRDPYGIYSTRNDYPTPLRKGIRGRDPLFLMGNNSLPVFAG